MGEQVIARLFQAVGEEEPGGVFGDQGPVPRPLPLGGFDGSPNAMAQGATRRARGEAFVKYTNDVLGAQGKIIIVPECGHNDRCVYTTDAVLPVIFPAP